MVFDQAEIEMKNMLQRLDAAWHAKLVVLETQYNLKQEMIDKLDQKINRLNTRLNTEEKEVKRLCDLLKEREKEAQQTLEKLYDKMPRDQIDKAVEMCRMIDTWVSAGW